MKSSDFQFLGFRVSEIHLKVAKEFNFSQRDLKIETNIQKNFFADNPRFVEIVMTLSASSDDKMISIHAEMHGGFQAHKDMDEDLFNKMSSQNAPAILFPFMRALISTVSAQANIPPIILPVVNLKVTE